MVIVERGSASVAALGAATKYPHRLVDNATSDSLFETERSDHVRSNPPTSQSGSINGRVPTDYSSNFGQPTPKVCKAAGAYISDACCNWG